MDKDKQKEAAEKKKKREEEKKHEDELLDEGLEETFPASDPPATSRPSKKNKK